MSKYNPQLMQQKYEQWRELYREQLAAQQRWIEARVLSKELAEYYQSPQWRKDHDADLDLQYSGNEHSIVSEDTLWNMLTDEDELAIRWMHLALDTIEKK